MHDPPETEEWLTRSQVAAELGVSLATVRRAEGDILHPVRDDRGVHRFSPAEVAAEASRRRGAKARAHDEVAGNGERNTGAASGDGELAAAAFRLFAEGRDPTEVVVALREAPHRIAQLHEQWAAMRKAVVLNSQAFSKLSRRLGRPVSSANLGDVLAELLDDHDRLRHFSYPCCECGEAIIAGPDEWEAVVASGVLAGWGHAGCIEFE